MKDRKSKQARVRDTIKKVAAEIQKTEDLTASLRGLRDRLQDDINEMKRQFETVMGLEAERAWVQKELNQAQSDTLERIKHARRLVRRKGMN